MAGVWNPVADQGATFRRVLEWTDETDAPFDLTGYAAQWRVYNTVSEALVYTATGASAVITPLAGRIELVIPALDTATLPLDTTLRHQLDLNLNGEITRLLEGRLRVRRSYP